MEEIDIDNLLDEGLPDDLRERKKMHNYEEKTKLVLEGKSNQVWFDLYLARKLTFLSFS